METPCLAIARAHAVRTLSAGHAKRKGRLVSGRTVRRRVMRITLPDEAEQSAAAPTRADMLVAEEPLGIRVNGTALTITMRSPGDDLELAAGFLVSEAVIRSPADIAEIKLCDGTSCGHAGHDELGNIAEVTLAAGVELAPGARRNFMTTGACGVCGRRASPTYPFCRMRCWRGLSCGSHLRCWPRSPVGCGARSACSRAPAACTPPGCSPPAVS
jgi:FdhD/NarQ family